MKTYLDILRQVSEHGVTKSNRTGVDTKSLFSCKFRHDLQDGFPLLTTKKVNFAKVAGELFGFLTGADSVEAFQKYGCDIWDPWGLSHEHYKIERRTDEALIAEYATIHDITVEETQARLQQTLTAAQKAKADMETYMLNPQNANRISMADEYYSNLYVASTKTAACFFREGGVPIMTKIPLMKEGYLGPIYGRQWTAWRTSTGEMINQVKELVHEISTNPMSRRHVLLGWNPEVVPKNKYVAIPEWNKVVETSKDGIDAAILDGKQALPPCHLLTILSVTPPTDTQPLPTLHLETIMRSTDVPIGLPFNIASYALLLKLVAKQVGMVAGEVVIEMVDCHIYADQLELAKVQLERAPSQLPTLELPDDLIIDIADPETLTPWHLQQVINNLTDYNPQPWIKYPVAV